MAGSCMPRLPVRGNINEVLDELMKVSIFFAWYDIWIGVFIDRKKRAVYVCPVPCLVFKFTRPESMTAKEFKEGLGQALRGETRPLSQLWGDFHADDESEGGS